MKNYMIQAMDDESYANYMTGSNNYEMRCFTVQAESAEEATYIAEHCFPSYHVNTRFIKTVDELIEREKQFEANGERRLKEREERRVKRKMKKRA